MKIAIVRGDFAAPGELPNFFPLAVHNQLSLFTGFFPVWNLGNTYGIKVEKLISPVDLNFGKISRFKMALLNRIFIDAHKLFGLENKLQEFDIAHCAETYYSFTQQCINAKEKGFIKAVFSTAWENIPFNNEGIRGRKEYKMRAFKKIDLFLAVTKRAKNVLIEEGCNSQKIEVLMPGVDLNRFKKSNHKFVFPKKFEGKMKLLFSGRLVEEKGIIELINIYKKIKSGNKDICLIIAGEGPLREKLEEEVTTEGIQDIEFLGKIPYFEMPQLYSSCDLLLHYPVGSATWKEQYGMALIEAMACALPILGLDQGSVAEIIGRGGIISDKKNYFSELILLIRNYKKLKFISLEAEKFAKSAYDSRRYARNLQNMYLAVLNKTN